MQAIVLAGGFGKRLSGVIDDVPKPMAKVDGIPFLEIVAHDLCNKGITSIVMAVGYKKEIIMSYFGYRYRNMDVCYSEEDSPLCTGGAVKKAFRHITDDHAFVINGDTYFDVNLETMNHEYIKRGMPICIAVKEMTDFSRYGEVKVGSNGLALGFEEKKHCRRGYINGGTYILRKNCVINISADVFSLESDYFPYKAEEGEIYAYIEHGKFIDIGIPEEYERAQTLLKGFMT